MIPALFVTHEESLADGGGGQQVCSREYFEALQLGGFDLTCVRFGTDRRFLTRVRRKLYPRPYHDHFDPVLLDRIIEAARINSPEFVFLNLNDLIPLGRALRRNLTQNIKLVLLSHGLASVDEVHAVRIAESDNGLRGAHRNWNNVGAMLQLEAVELSAFDHVFCLAPFEAEICRWLGAKSVSAVPRSVVPTILDWKPSGNRLGFIGTMSHPPNEEGFWLFLREFESLANGVVRIRLISRSEEVCKAAASKYPFVDYLGAIEDESRLREEVSTWNAFIHPLFCYAMGCSTKVSVVLAWGIPLLTTPAGIRGYEFMNHKLTTVATPKEMALKALDLLDRTNAEAARKEVIGILASAPSLEEIGAEMIRALGRQPINSVPITDSKIALVNG